MVKTDQNSPFCFESLYLQRIFSTFCVFPLTVSHLTMIKLHVKRVNFWIGKAMNNKPLGVILLIQLSRYSFGEVFLSECLECGEMIFINHYINQNSTLSPIAFYSEMIFWYQQKHKIECLPLDIAIYSFFENFLGKILLQRSPDCAKSLNLNKIKNQKMAYVQQFFERYLPQYYLTTLREHHNKKDFFDFNNNFNVYSITLDLLSLAHHQPTNYFTRQWLSDLINRQLFISYDNLRHYKMPSQEGDSEIVCFMKSTLQFVKRVFIQVHNVSLQLLIRLIAIFLECFESQYLNNTTLSLIEDLTNIYPALKTQVSINCPEMNLNNFLEKYITLIINPCNSQAALLALNKIKAECNFMGQTQKLLDSIILKKKNQIEILQKKSDSTSNQSEEESDRISKNTKENYKNFSQAEIFRKKKSRSFMKTTLETALKPTRSMQTIQATPLKVANSGSRFTPRSQRTKGKSLQIKNKDTNKSPIKKTPLFKKIKKQKKPLERTIYFGQTKKFIPKKTANLEDTFDIKHILVTGILSEHLNLFDYQKKTEKKRPEEREDLNAPLFFVPETPRVPASRIRKYEEKIVPTNLFKVK